MGKDAPKGLPKSMKGQTMNLLQKLFGGESPTGVDEPGTDFGALQAGYVSITPLQLDLTHYKAMDVLKKWKF